jgi:hypothetical protein
VKGRVNVRKFLILAVLVGAAVFTAVSLANSDSKSAIQPQLPGKAKTLNAHRMTTTQGKALGVKASANGSKLGLKYLFSDFDVAPGQTRGGAIKCPKKWHPVSGLFATDSRQVVTASDAPISQRKWGIFVRNEANTGAKVTVGAVCVKGLPVL